MATITIRNLNAEVKRKLQIRAATHGRSMEEEARTILASAVSETTEGVENLYESIRRHVASFGGSDLELPERGPIGKPVEFHES